MPPYIIVDPRDDKETWTKMWARLARLPDNKNRPDPQTCYNEGEVWQYMCTVYHDSISRLLVHHFRHRRHPRNDERMSAVIFTPVQETT